MQLKLKDLTYAIVALIITALLATEWIAPELFQEYKLVKLSMIAVLSIFVIMKSASNIIYSMSEYAKKTGISEYLIGFLILSVGTSIPDLTTGVIASFTKQGNLVLGSVIGANIINITVLLGLAAIISRHMKVEGKILNKTIVGVIVVSTLPLVLGIDGNLSKIDGIILVGAFFSYLYLLYMKEGKLGNIKQDVKLKNLWKDMFIFLGSLIALLLSARWLVVSSIEIGKTLEIPMFLFGLFVVALATTSPELTITIKTLFGKGKGSFTFGNILGSVVANSSLVLGISSIIRPIPIHLKTFILPALFMIMAVFIGVLFIKKKEISWQEGIGLLLIYITFIVSQIVMGV